MANKEDLEVMRAIGQAAANAYDGALDDGGKPVVVGLDRDKGNSIIDSRIADGFKVKMVGKNLLISYQSDVFLKDVHANNFEGELERKMSAIVTYLKKEFKKSTKQALRLKDLGEVDALVQQTSRVRVFVIATKTYEIGNYTTVDAVKGDTNIKDLNNRLEEGFQDFLAEGAWKA
tara:strand:+ start:71 stop:595 length:525 start_codon:yes stop_codon:yes gene_type:complete